MCFICAYLLFGCDLQLLGFRFVCYNLLVLCGLNLLFVACLIVGVFGFVILVCDLLVGFDVCVCFWFCLIN